MSKVELFEVIRREHFIHGKGIRRIAREQGVHRRLVRQAIGNALPPTHKVAEREAPVLTKALQGVIDGWLGGDREAPRKQHHTQGRGQVLHCHSAPSGLEPKFCNELEKAYC